MSNDGSALLQLKSERRDHGCILTVQGEIDVVTAPDLTEAIDDVLGAPVAMLVLDLRSVAFMGSAGLAVLVETQQKITQRGGRFAVIADGDATSRSIEIAGLGRLLTVHRTVEAAGLAG